MATATVIDTLVVELGLDPAKFTDAQRNALDSLRKFEEGAEAQGKRVESQTKKLNDVLTGFKREAMSLVGLFVGGMGVKEFIGYVTNLDAATGRVAKTMNMGAAEVGAWQGAVKQVGGSSESATGALQGLSGEMNRFMLTGQSTMLPVLSRLGISLFDQNRNLKTAGQLWLDIAKAVEGMDPAKATAFLSMIPGINQDMTNLLLKGPRAIEAYLEAARRAGTTSKESSEQAEIFQRSLNRLGDAATNAGRAVMQYLYPPLTFIADKLRELIQMNPAAAGLLGTLVAIVGLRGAWRGARSLLTGGGAAAATGTAAGAAAGAGGGTAAATTAGASAAAAAPKAGMAVGRLALRALGPVGMYFGGTDDAAAPTLTDRWDKPYMGPEPQKSTEPAKTAGAPSAAEIEDYIRKAAVARSIDPNIAVRVAASEGLHAYQYSPTGQSFVPGEQSFGPFQLNYAKNGRSLGDQFTRSTGLDARDSSTWKQQVDFALDKATKTGWKDWYGWKGPAFAGIGGPAAPLGAAASAAAGGSFGGSTRGGNSTTVTTQIGKVEVNAPQARDAEGVAREIGPALKRQVDAGMANYGSQ